MSTNGLGFHEYLQLCEDLGAAPLFVINCGMSHKENVPMDKMGEWVQDALDAIEYANGPADSTWGSLRAKAGHPAPFDLRYMEIGNENGGPAYQERYALFYDAIKAKYPDMQLIGNEPTKSRPSDIVDEHYYSSPEFFMGQAHRYDTYPRTGAKIYVGEYACTQKCGQGNLIAALGEAAFMTGMERNSDVVTMSSYAPLFANTNYKKWTPDLIDFDSARVYGIPSYYAQKLFSENRGDVVLPCALTMPEAPSAEAKHGGIGVATWATQAEYKDLRVTQGGKVLFASDFANGLDGMKTVRGEWSVQDGALRQTSNGTDLRVLAGDPAWTDYTFSLKARKLGGAEGFMVLFHTIDDGNWVWWNLGGWQNRWHGLEQCENGAKATFGDKVEGKIETGKWYDLRVELKDGSIKCYLDDKLIHDVKCPKTDVLYATASRDEKADEVIIKAVNVSKEPLNARIALSGVQEVAGEGTAIVLTSADPLDENTLDQPEKVAPKASTIKSAKEFEHELPAYSLSILRLKVK